MGVNYAHLQVQQKTLKQKSKKMEEENAQSSKTEGGTVKKLIVEGKRSKGKKIYPGGLGEN